MHDLLEKVPRQHVDSQGANGQNPACDNSTNIDITLTNINTKYTHKCAPCQANIHPKMPMDNVHWANLVGKPTHLFTNRHECNHCEYESVQAVNLRRR